MIGITAYALEAAITAIDDKIWSLKAQIDEATQDPSDLEDKMIGYMKAAYSLRASYEDAVKQGHSLVPYEKLVR